MAKRVRARLSWTPRWEGPIKGWTKKFIRQNHWRCDHVHDKDDLLQDAYLTFLRICKKYPRVMDAPHFMTLYKRAIWNEMHDRARYVRRKRVVHEATSQDASDLYAERIGEMTNPGYFTTLLNEAPPELKAALAVLADNPEALRGKGRRGQRQNLNMRLRRVLGFDKMRLDVHKKFDLASALSKLGVTP